jgi:hypothetical protein
LVDLKEYLIKKNLLLIVKFDVNIANDSEFNHIAYKAAAEAVARSL